MKKLYFILSVLLYFSAHGQIVNIPDANFKARLLSASTDNYIAIDLNDNNVAIDTNNDGEIQVTEAQAIARIYLNAPYDITSVEGIQSFTNLVELGGYGQPVMNVDISGMSIEAVTFLTDDIENFNASGCTNLVTINLGLTMGSLDVSGCTALEELIVPNVQELNVDGCTALKIIDCPFNEHATSFDITLFPNLEYFEWTGNLTGFIAENHNTIKGIGIINGDLENVNISNCGNLEMLSFIQCNMTDFTLAGCPLLYILQISENPLQTLNINGTSLTGLTLSGGSEMTE